MDFEFTPEQESFRHKVRAWLDANLPKDLCVDDAQDERIAPNREVFERRRAWQAKLHSAGYAGLSWPKEYGGHAATLIEQVIWDEEYSRARAPVLPNYFGLGLCGPTLMNWGTEAQKKRFLPRILGADDIWCQGYSEPGAGSDLAGLSTRAADMGDYFLVNGQKVWTSGAQYADWMFMLARTDPEAPKHRGISYLLLDMKSAGVTVRPLVLMNGHSHFNEVFFDNVQVPKENLVGPLNEGWKVAMTTLSYERCVRRRWRPRLAGAAPRGTREDRKHRRQARVGAGVGAPAACAIHDRMRSRALHAVAIAHAPTARIAAWTRGLDAQTVRLRTRRAHRALLD